MCGNLKPLMQCTLSPTKTTTTMLYVYTQIINYISKDALIM